jgi:hypothetical protein
MWKKEAMVEFKIQYWDLCGRPEEKTKIKSKDSWYVG